MSYRDEKEPRKSFPMIAPPLKFWMSRLIVGSYLSNLDSVLHISGTLSARIGIRE